MDATDPIYRFTEAVTSELKDDAELRLDVSAEVRSHIEEAAAALRAEGKGEAESLELALKAFGSPAEVAGALGAANRRRMRLRALARLAARAVLVPAALVVALVVCRRHVRLVGEAGAWLSLGSSGVGSPSGGGSRGLAEETRFLLHGDESRPTQAGRQRAIWQAHPENKVYFGNYVTHLVQEYSAESEGGPSLEMMEEELGQGEGLDPENGRYPLLLASLWAERACTLEEREAEEGNGEPQAAFAVKDRALLGRAMAKVLEGAEKPYLRTYSKEMLCERLRALPPARRLEDQIGRVAWAAGTLLPDCARHRHLAKLIPHCAALLASEGKAAEAEALLGAWEPLGVKMGEDAFTLVEILVAGAVIQAGSEASATELEKLGRGERAAAMRARAKQLAAPLEAWKAGRKTFDHDQERRLIQEAGVLDGMLVPAIGADTLKEIDLDRGRTLEQTVVEDLGVTVCVLMLLAVALGGLVAALRWRWARGVPAAPLLVLPGWRTSVRILALGTIVPLGVFYVYTRWSGLAGREYSLGFLGHRFGLELCLLATTIVGLTVAMTTSAVRRRCDELGLEVPPRSRWAPPLWGALAVLWVLCLVQRGQIPLGHNLGAMAYLWVGGMLVVLLPVMVVARWLTGRREHGLYLGTIARSVIPALAAAAILVGGLAHPYLGEAEARLVAQETTLSGRDDLVGFTRVEALLVDRLKRQLAEAAAQPPSTP